MYRNAVMDSLTFIAGRHVPAQSGEWLDNHDPATGSPYGKVASSDARDVQAAVASAERAFPAWSSLPAQERSRRLRNIARLIERDKDRLARAESIEGGFSLRSIPGRGTALEVVLRT